MSFFDNLKIGKLKEKVVSKHESLDGKMIKDYYKEQDNIFNDKSERLQDTVDKYNEIFGIDPVGAAEFDSLVAAEREKNSGKSL